MAECFSCMSPRVGKGDIKQQTVFRYDEIQAHDRRDEREQINTEDEKREEPSTSLCLFSNVSKRSQKPSSKAAPTSKKTGDLLPLEQNKPKAISKQEEILRKCGILYLDEKVTRARVHESESEEAILREAGISIVDASEHKQEVEKKLKNINVRKLNENVSSNSISHRDANILKKLGVLSLAHREIQEEIQENKAAPIVVSLESCPCSESTVSTGSVNSSYAESKLRRRLRKGWTNTGRECVCGMPVICNKAKGIYECVICGVVGDEKFDGESFEESHGVFLLRSDTNASTLPSLDATEYVNHLLETLAKP